MQTTFTQTPDLAYPGMPADIGIEDDVSAVVEETGGIEPGLVVVRGLGGDRTARLPPTVSADDDAIILAHATVAGALVLGDDPAELTGVIGAGRIYPPARLDLTLSSHANFDLSTWPLILEDENGVRITENFAVPDGGNTILRTVAYVSRVIQLTQPTQSGTGGSFKLGVSADRSLGGGDVLGVSMRTQKARNDFAVTGVDKYEDETIMPVRRQGRVYVQCENAFTAGQRPLVRCIAAGAEKLGALRVGDSDSGDCFPWPGARLVSSGGAGDLGILEVKQL